MTDTSAPQLTRNRWNIQQVAERLDALVRDLRALADDTARPRDDIALRQFQRESVGYLRDMAILMTGEMPESAAARKQAEQLCALADKLLHWAQHPTDTTGNHPRAAYLHGAAASIAEWAEALR